MSGFLGFWEGKKLSCQFMTATSFLQGELVRDEEFYTGPRTREEEKMKCIGVLGKDGQALQRAQHGWRYRYRYGHRYRYIGAMAGEERVGLTRASGFILFWSATKAKPSAVGASQSAEAAQYRSSGGTIR